MQVTERYLPSSSNEHSCQLADAVLEAPTLLATMPCQDWSALAGCNRQLHTVIHNSVQAITVTDASEVSLCVKGTWQQLALIKEKPPAVPDWDRHHLPLPGNTNFQLIASLASSSSTETAIAKIVRRNLLTETNEGSHIAVALSHLSGPGWQRIDYLRVKLYMLSTEVIVQLVHLDLQFLTRLDITNSNLGLAAMQQLAQGAWPQLGSLNLSKNLIDEVAICALIQGKWPLLGTLILDENHLLSAAAITCISEAPNWAPLASLSLKGVKLDTAGACAIARLHGHLHCLFLSSNGLWREGASELFSVPWPCLHNLRLLDDQLGADAIAAMALTSLPEIEVLTLENNKLDTSAMWELVKCGFPCLEQLFLDFNRLDDFAMASLAEGQWPSLSWLSLAGNKIKARGVRCLTRGDWPRLWSLRLDSSAVSKATWRALALVSDEFPNPTASCDYNIVYRDLSGLDSPIWPQLDSVCFVDVSLAQTWS